jgi:hypothetical protein
VVAVAEEASFTKAAARVHQVLKLVQFHNRRFCQ